jgi:hypothetical protein
MVTMDSSQTNPKDIKMGISQMAMHKVVEVASSLSPQSTCQQHRIRKKMPFHAYPIN